MENAIPIFLCCVMAVLGILSFLAYRKVYSGGRTPDEDLEDEKI
jgi:hypothetical protein